MKINSKGLVLLEYAAVLVLSLPVLLLLFDAVNIFRLRTVLQESVRQSLRCLTPTDTDCHIKNQANYQPIYEADIYEGGLQYPIENYQYNLETEWLALQNYQYSDPNADIIDNFTYRSHYVERYTTEAIHNPKVNLNYLTMFAIAPFVDTLNLRSFVTDPAFKLFNSSGPQYGKGVFSSLRQINGTNTTSTIKYIGSQSFIVPNRNNLPCFKSIRVSALDNARSMHSADFSSPCSGLYVPATIHVRGNFPSDALANGSQGVVYMHLVGPTFYINGVKNGSGTYNLGGREFAYRTGDVRRASFVPRGVRSGYYTNSYGYVEFEKYKNIRLKVGEKYKIKFYLKKVGKKGTRTRWKGKDLRVFFPLLNYNKPTKVNCLKYDPITYGNGTYKTNCRDAKYLNQSLPGSLLKNTIVETTYKEKYLGCFHPETKTQKACPTCSIREVDNMQCPQSYAQKKFCKENKGVDGNPNIVNSTAHNQAKQICNVSVKDRISPRFPIRFYQKNIKLNASFDYLRENCEAPIDAPKDRYPANLQAYPKLKWAKKTRLSDLNFYTDGANIQEFKQNNPEYDCDQILEKTKNYNFNNLEASQVPEEIKTSLLYGSHSQAKLGCEREDVVKDNAVNVLDLNPEIYLKVNEQQAGFTYQETKPEHACHNLLPRNIKLATAALLDTIGPLSSGEIPEECNDPEKYCEFRLIGYEKEGEDSHEINQEVAKQKGFATVKAAYPRALNNCEGVDCFNMNIDFNGEDFRVNAELELPLRLLLGKKRMTINYQDIGHWEGIYEQALKE